MHGCQQRPHKIHARVIKVGLAQPLSAHAQLQNRHRRRVVLDDERRSRSRRGDFQDCLHNRRHLRLRRGNLHTRLEVHLDDRDALVALALCVLDIVDGRRQRPLADRHDAAAHLRRRQTRIVPHHRDDGNIDVRKDVLRRLNRCPDAQHGDQQRQHDERIRAAQRQSYDPHIRLRRASFRYSLRRANPSSRLACLNLARKRRPLHSEAALSLRSSQAHFFACSKRLFTSAQFTTFHHAAR